MSTDNQDISKLLFYLLVCSSMLLKFLCVSLSQK